VDVYVCVCLCVALTNFIYGRRRRRRCCRCYCGRRRCRRLLPFIVVSYESIRAHVFVRALLWVAGADIVVFVHTLTNPPAHTHKRRYTQQRQKQQRRRPQ